MPLYDFACDACGERFEQHTAVGAPAPACPLCGSAQTRRVFSVPALWRTNKTPGQRRRNEAQRADMKERKREQFAREQRSKQQREEG